MNTNIERELGESLARITALADRVTNLANTIAHRENVTVRADVCNERCDSIRAETRHVANTIQAAEQQIHTLVSTTNDLRQRIHSIETSINERRKTTLMIITAGSAIIAATISALATILAR